MKKLKKFYILWSTQSLSALGSAMTNYALTLWLYRETGSALETALLSVCSYAPYVIMSIFAGALSDLWDKKKTMLVCDALAALSTVTVFALLKTGTLCIWHLYLLNAFNGLMNTVQSPASDVAMSLITPKEYFQKTSGLRSASNSLVTILHPLTASVLFAAGGIDIVVYIDIATFLTAFIALMLFVDIPAIEKNGSDKREPLLKSVKAGLACLRSHRLVLLLILFLSGVNFVASCFDSALPAFVLPRANGREKALGLVNSCAGIAMLAGSLIMTVLPPPKNRVRVITLTMLFSLTVENFLISTSDSLWLWCIAQALGWFVVPIMSANLDVIVRMSIPTDMQGRVYSCRNTLQFFTIPIGRFLGGWLIDKVFEPYMETAPKLMTGLFGSQKGSGAGLLIFTLGLCGLTVCLVFGKILSKYTFSDRKEYK